MSHSYKAEYPAGTSVDPGIVQFFEEFYAISDVPGEHDRYVDMLTDDATFIMASKKARGRDGMNPQNCLPFLTRLHG